MLRPEKAKKNCFWLRKDGRRPEKGRKKKGRKLPTGKNSEPGGIPGRQMETGKKARKRPKKKERKITKKTIRRKKHIARKEK